MIRPFAQGRMHVDERQPSRSAGHSLHERLGLFDRHGIRGIAFIGLEVQGKEGPWGGPGRVQEERCLLRARANRPCRSDRCPKAILPPRLAAVARHTRGRRRSRLRSPCGLTASMLLARTSRKSETVVCALRSITASSPRGLSDSMVPARSGLQAADFEVAAFADKDPAPRRPDGVPEVHCIPSSLQQPGPR